MNNFLAKCIVFGFIAGGSALVNADAAGQIEPRVARVQMRLTFSEDLVDVIEKGDLLTVLEDRGENYLIRTHAGRKGLVAKANAVDLAEAQDIYTELIEASPEEGRLYTLRAGARWAAGDADSALEDFDRAIGLGYQEAHAYMSRGLFYAARGEHDKAVEDYTVAIEKEPNEVAARINRAAAYILKGQLDLAIEDYNRAIEGRPNDAILHQQRAVAYKAMGNFDAAMADFSRAIEIAGPDKPAAIPALMSRGYLCFQQAKHEEAVRDFGAVIEINPKASVAYNNRGYNLYQLGKAVDALRDYEQAILLEPKYGLAHQNRAWLLATTDNEKLRDPKAAVDSATTACELSDYKDVSDMAALAAASASNGEFDVAVGWQEKVVEQASPAQKSFAEKILDLYVSKKPFDPKLAAALAKESKTESPQVESTKAAAPTKPAPVRKQRAL